MKGSVWEKTNKFWETHLAGRWPGEVQLHCLVPTAMITRPRPYDPKEYPQRSEVEHESTRLHQMCCICEQDLAGKPSMVLIRCLVSKFEAACSTYANGVMSKKVPGFMYRAAYMSANACGVCFAKLHKEAISMKLLQADHHMVHHLLDSLEAINMNLREDFTFEDVSVESYLVAVLTSQQRSQAQLLKEFGKMDATCNTCGKKGVTNRCGGCQYYHYCNSHCCKSDWPLHKSFCKWLQTGSIVIVDEFVKIK